MYIYVDDIIFFYNFFVVQQPVLPRTLLYCTENVAGIHACIRGRGQGSLDPPENRRNIVFPCNAGPVKNHKVANLAFNVGASSVCQQIQWRFAGGPMSSR